MQELEGDCSPNGLNSIDLCQAVLLGRQRVLGRAGWHVLTPVMAGASFARSQNGSGWPERK